MGTKIILPALIGILVLGGFMITDSFAAKNNDNGNGATPNGIPFLNLQEQLDALNLDSLIQIFVDKDTHNNDMENLENQIDALSSKITFLESVLDNVNIPPTADVGPDLYVSGTTTLTSVAIDDGFTLPLTYSWSQTTGSGFTTFSDPTGISTDVSFTDFGSYEIEFSAFDGIATASDALMVENIENLDFVAYVKQSSGHDGILLNNGPNSLSYSSLIGQRSTSLDVADFNRDGIFDVASTVYHNGGGAVYVNLGNDDGTLDSAIITESNALNIWHIKVGNFNDDDIPDVIVFGYEQWPDVFFEVFLGNGDGTFDSVQTSIEYTYSIGDSRFAVGDLDGDGIDDVAMAVFDTPGSADVYLNNGDGTFENPGSYSIYYTWPRSVAIADMNNDQSPDLILSSGTGAGFTILTNNGDGTFRDDGIFGSTGASANNLFVYDINDDGNNDIIATSYWYGTLVVTLGTDSQYFSSPKHYGLGMYNTVPAIGDFNRDGLPDIITGGIIGYNTYGLRIFENTGDYQLFTVHILETPTGVFEDLATGTYN